MNHYIVLTMDGQVCDIGFHEGFDEADHYVSEELDLEPVWVTTIEDWKDMFKDIGYQLKKKELMHEDV